MKITVLTLFPEMVTCFLTESIVKRAQEKNLIEIEVVNLRDFAKDKYRTVDDRPYGGGAGMVLKVDVLFDAISSVSSRTWIEGEESYKDEIPCRYASGNDRDELKQKIILTSPRGIIYTQSIAQKYSKLDHLILIAGHYEGVDERVLSYVDEEMSLGNFVLTGGEIAVAAIVDSIVRLLPGVLKKKEATRQESFFEVSIDQLMAIIGKQTILEKLDARGVKKVRLLEYPHYSRPEVFRGSKVPKILLSGNHAQINKWQLKMAYKETIKRRNSLLEEK